MNSICDFGPAPEVPDLLNLAQHTLAHASVSPNKVALTLVGPSRDEARRYTYGELQALVFQVAGGLSERGIKAGDRVVLRIGHSIDFPILFLATTSIGAVAVPTSSILTDREVQFITENTDARLLVCSKELQLLSPSCAQLSVSEISGPPVDGFAETNANDLAYIIFTSGSSGNPKGVAHAHRAAFARRMMWDGWYGLTPEDTVIHAGAFNWTYTLGAGLMDPWASGASALIYTGPKDPSIWPELVKRFGPTIFAATPGVYRQMLKYATDLSGLACLRHGLSAGEAMPENVLEDWQAQVGKPIYGALGMTECSTFVSSSPLNPVVDGYVGRVQDGRKIAILRADRSDSSVPLGEVGEISIDLNDPGLMKEYWKNPSETRRAMVNCWFRTGDLGSMNENGYIRYEGRLDDQMNAQGYRVAPQEIENALLKYPGILSVAAVELPVRKDLSLITAFYTSETGEHCEWDLSQHCMKLLASYKVPKIFRMVDDLPRSPNGKLQRKQLVKQFSDQLPASSI